jgi:N-acetylneuraminic acid mutarotase
MASSLVYAGNILVIGGEYAHGQSRSNIYRYNPAANEWTSWASLPAARRGGVAGIFGTKLIVATGSYGGRQSGDTTMATLPASL